MSEESPRYFQWTASENQGQIVIYDHVEEDDNEIYICFKNGTRINQQFVAPIGVNDLTNKLMAEITDPSNVWTFKERWIGRIEERWSLPEESPDGQRYCVQEATPGRKVIDLIPPKRYTPTKTSQFGYIHPEVKPESVQQSVQDIVTTVQNKVTTVQNKVQNDSSDPVNILLNKSKKVDTDFSMDLTISLPSKDLYNMVKENFEEGDIKTLDYIINNLDIDAIKESLKTALKNVYDNE